MMSKILGLLLLGICKVKGLQLVRAESYDELLAADEFRQNIYTEYYSMKKLTLTPELIRPKGLVTCWCLKKNSQIVGSVSLIDLTCATSYAASVFEGSHLEYDAQKTYEFTRLTVDRKYQRSDHFYFLLLVYACYRDTIRDGRTQWLACSHKRVMRQIHQFGGKTQVVANQAKIATDDSYQSVYWSNLKLDERTMRDYRAYLVSCDDKMLVSAVRKFIKRKLLKLSWS